MYFLFSGEGPTDLGVCKDNAAVCEADNFDPGPMAVIVDQIVSGRQNYSLLEAGCYGLVSMHAIVEGAAELKAVKKGIRLPGKKRPKETQYFFKNARVLARMAQDKESESNDQVVAVLFRDADTATGGRGDWQPKRQSMLDGFVEEGFTRGVPMIPKPKSEAWLLCALQEHPYRRCAALEDRSGSSNSPHPLKRELEERLRRCATREVLFEKVADRTVDIERIDMPSFAAFRTRLEEVI